MQSCPSCRYARVLPGRMCPRCGTRPPQGEKTRQNAARHAPRAMRGPRGGHQSGAVVGDAKRVRGKSMTEHVVDAVIDGLADTLGNGCGDAYGFDGVCDGGGGD